MAGGVLSPRQKMINMMYLVLTALLAMNVSSEVLEAFRIVEVGIENSNKVLDDKIKNVDAALVAKAADSKTGAKAKPLLEKSKEISGITKGLISYISEIKATLLLPENSGNRLDENGNETGEPEKLDDIDSGTRLLADKEAAPAKFQGKIFQDKINAIKAELMLALKDVKGVKPEELAQLEAGLTLTADDSKDPNKDHKEWYYQFHHVPTPGVMTMLTKIENDALSAEATINEFLLNRIGKLDFKFDKLRATVQAEKAYLPGGAQYEANIFLTASSAAMIAETYVGNLDWSKFKKDSVGDFLPYNSADDVPFKGTPKMLGANGKLTRGTSVGQNGYSGAIKIANPAGGNDWYPFKGSYEGAAAGGFSASPTKMNVLYIGVDNPMTITVGDAKPGSLRASLSGGSISKSGNGWVAKVSKQGKTTLTASGTTPEGKPTKSFNAEFRVKRIPDPVPTLGGKLIGGNIKKGTLAAQTGVIALLKDFDFDARFTVTGYNFTLVSKGEIFSDRGIRGPVISSKAKNLLKRARPKDIAIFEKIKVKGPDGTTRTLTSLTFTII